MKRTLTYISGVLLLIPALCISCQKEQNSLKEKGAPANEVVIRATISDAATKVSFTEDDNKLKTAWETDDHIVGWDAEGNAIELEIASIEDNTAIFKKVEGSAAIPTSGNVYMIYAPGKSMADISNSSLEYDLSNQDSGKLPALMTATGEVSNNVLALNFTNRLAIVAVKNPKFQVTEETNITSLQLSGDNILTTASFSEDGSGGLQMNSSVNGTITRACSFTTGTDGTSDTMVYFAVLPNTTEANVTVSTSNPTGYQISFSGKSFTAGQCYMLNQTNINKQTFTVTVADGITGGTISTSPSGNVAWGTEVTVTPAPADGYELATLIYNDGTDHDIKDECKFTMPAKNVTVTATFKKSHDYVTIGGKKWATTNIGATNPQDYGKYFQWGEIAGHECNGTYNFNWASAPFNNEQSSFNSSYFTENISKWLTNYVLNSGYDAANVNWGSPWRMPTKDDFTALANACKDGGYSDGQFSPTGTKASFAEVQDKGVYWITNYNSGDGKKGLVFCDGTNRLFFPAAGVGNATSLNGEGSNVIYWSSTLNSSTLYDAYRLYFDGSKVNPQNSSRRFNGSPVRPVSD